jgi:hypothetical protein
MPTICGNQINRRQKVVPQQLEEGSKLIQPPRPVVPQHTIFDSSGVHVAEFNPVNSYYQCDTISKHLRD